MRRSRRMLAVIRIHGCPQIAVPELAAGLEHPRRLKGPDTEVERIDDSSLQRLAGGNLVAAEILDHAVSVR